MVTVSHEDVYSLVGTDSSHIALLEGEQVPLEALLYATMMASANDGANALAEYFGGGSIADGVAAMNAQAAELGAEAHPLRQPPRHQRRGPLHQLLRYGLHPALGPDPAGV